MYRLFIVLLYMVCGPHATTSIDLFKMTPDLTCSPQAMRACFPKDPSFLINSDTTKNGACYQYETNDAAVCVIAKLKRDQCGVTARLNSTHATYSSSLIMNQDVGMGLIMRNDTVTVNINCSYALDSISTLSLMIQMVETSSSGLRSYVINVNGDGTFNFNMALYQYSNYTGAYPQAESGGLTLSTNTILYIGIFTDVGDTETFALLMTDCFATPTDDINAILKHHIIQNRCPNPADLSIGIDENGVSSYGRFYMKMFKFIGGYDNVYLHCKVTLCNKIGGSCQSTCGVKSASIAAADGSFKTVSLGPIRASGVRASWSSLLPVMVLMLGFLFLLCNGPNPMCAGPRVKKKGSLGTL